MGQGLHGRGGVWWKGRGLVGRGRGLVDGVGSRGTSQGVALLLTLAPCRAWETEWAWLLCRWRRNQDGGICRRSIKKMLEVLVLRHPGSELWALPGVSPAPAPQL